MMYSSLLSASVLMLYRSEETEVTKIEVSREQSSVVENKIYCGGVRARLSITPKSPAKRHAHLNKNVGETLPRNSIQKLTQKSY